MRTMTIAAVSLCVAASFTFMTGSFAQVPPAHKMPANQSVFVTLGTQSGPIPSVDRAQPANVVMWRDEVILVDAGDGVVEQLAKAGVPLGTVSAVLVSHLH